MALRRVLRCDPYARAVCASRVLLRATHMRATHLVDVGLRADEEVDYAVEMCLKHVERLREMSPLWEMVQEGIDLKSIQWSSH